MTPSKRFCLLCRCSVPDGGASAGGRVPGSVHHGVHDGAAGKLLCTHLLHLHAGRPQDRGLRLSGWYCCLYAFFVSLYLYFAICCLFGVFWGVVVFFLLPPPLLGVCVSARANVFLICVMVGLLCSGLWVIGQPSGKLIN